MERRSVPAKCEVREVDGKRLFVGKPVVYNERSNLLYGHFYEQITPGAFDACLRGDPDIIATVDHDFRRLLGRTQSKTLRLSPDDAGISCEVDDAGYSYAADLREALTRGDLRGMSFTFDVKSDSWDRGRDHPVRTVLEADIFEVAFVFHPAYDASEAGYRSQGGAGEAAAIEKAKSLAPRPSLRSLRLKLREVAG